MGILCACGRASDSVPFPLKSHRLYPSTNAHFHAPEKCHGNMDNIDTSRIQLYTDSIWRCCRGGNQSDHSGKQRHTSRNNGPNLSPMSRQARALHIIRASSQPGRLRFADIAHLDQTITTMRRLVPPVSSTTVPEKINTVEDLETLLIDTIHLFKRLIEDPEIVTALRARLASKTTAASNEVPVTAPHLSVPSVQTEVDNLFTLLKLKRRSKKRIIPMRI